MRVLCPMRTGMSSSRSMSQRLRDVVQEEFEYCRNHPAYFIRTYCQIEDKDADGLMIPFEMWPAQEKALYSIAAHRLNIILKARQIGFTWLCLAYILHDLVFNIGHTGIAFSKTEIDAFELGRRFSVLLNESGRRMLEHLGIYVVKLNKREVSVIGGGIASRFLCFPASPEAGRSYTGNIILYDEFAFNPSAAEMWVGALPTVNRPNGGKIIVLSTMKRGTKYEDIWNDDENGFNRIFLGCFADPRRTWAWYEDTQRAMGKKILQEYPRNVGEALANLEGIFFEEFDPSVHVVRPFEIPAHWRITSSMDYGHDMLAHYKVAEDEEGNAYVFHEIYKPKLVVSEAALEILHADERDGVPWTIPVERYAPPDLWAVEAGSGESQAQRYYNDGVDLIKVSNNRESGWNAVKELLRGRDGKPRLYVFSTCPNLIRTLGMICIDEKNPNDCKKDPHELTHAPDALRYWAIYYRQKAEKQERKTEKRREWSEDLWEDYVSASDDVKALILKRHGRPSNYEI